MIYERIKHLANGNISINQLEKKLGISSGSLCKIDKNKPSSEKLQKIADYFGVSLDYLMTGEESESYYLNKETSQIAQDIFENKELRLLFDSARDAEPEDLEAVHNMLLALKRKEQNYDD